MSSAFSSRFTSHRDLPQTGRSPRASLGRGGFPKPIASLEASSRWLALCLTLSATACVSQGKYDAKVAELDSTATALEDERAKHAAERDRAAALADKLNQVQAALGEATTAAAALRQKIEAGQQRTAELEQALQERESTVAALQQQLDNEKRLLAEFMQLAEAYGAKTPEDLKRAIAELQQKVQQTEAALRSAAMELERERRISQKLQALIDAGKLRVRRRNGRLVIELPGDIHFASGSAKLTQVGSDTLGQLAPVLNAEQDRLFVVEGHTDNVPIAVSGFRSNWHLGSNRAETSRDALVAAGLAGDRVAIASWADLLPVCPQVDDPPCRQRNRRVEVVLLPRFE